MDYAENQSQGDALSIKEGRAQRRQVRSNRGT